jgi:hypothetical protein
VRCALPRSVGLVEALGDDPLQTGVDVAERPGAGDGGVGGSGCEHESVRRAGGQELLELAAPLPVGPVAQVDAALAE